ncbi:serine/threonine-protein kinase RsbT [Terriglobus roseus]|uniref:Serine/threonine-protein kinase RsbT n=1 Tax=Terriglobus roseus TaxID=392734 RepID=A0A1G7HDV5_9BACT|nr:serine/threonine-protein kinase RsbT [Terriglobus roseus]
MEVLKSDSLPVRTSEDIVIVRTSVRKLATELRFGIVDQTKIVTAASEIARNTLDYGRGGDLQMQSLVNGTKKGLRLIFADQGPGIRDLDQALTDGFTSGNGMGLGLGGTRRLMDEFEIASKLNEGTTVTITKWSR